MNGAWGIGHWAFISYLSPLDFLHKSGKREGGAPFGDKGRGEGEKVLYYPLSL
ncbi:hypothetical protein NIES2100_50110 [Calothrix sp. NIES-2100]|nr:hypothetical protein NIES2100_50110 [Calothrix sp. NIES-2100]